jgi:hypothetical protein
LRGPQGRSARGATPDPSEKLRAKALPPAGPLPAGPMSPSGAKPLEVDRGRVGTISRHLVIPGCAFPAIVCEFKVPGQFHRTPAGQASPHFPQNYHHGKSSVKAASFFAIRWPVLSLRKQVFRAGERVSILYCRRGGWRAGVFAARSCRGLGSPVRRTVVSKAGSLPCQYRRAVRARPLQTAATRERRSSPAIPFLWN